MESKVLKDKKVTLYYGSQTPDKMAYKVRSHPYPYPYP